MSPKWTEKKCHGCGNWKKVEVLYPVGKHLYCLRCSIWVERELRRAGAKRQLRCNGEKIVLSHPTYSLRRLAKITGLSYETARQIRKKFNAQRVLYVEKVE